MKQDSSKAQVKTIEQLRQLVANKEIEIAHLHQELKASRENQREIKYYYEDLIALLPGHVYWFDTNNVIQGCNNQQAESMHLPSREAVKGKTLYDVLPKSVADLHLETNNRILKTGEEYYGEEESIYSAEPEIYLTKKVPLYNRSGKVIGLLGISLDITERKRMEVELREAKDKAEAAS